MHSISTAQIKLCKTHNFLYSQHFQWVNASMVCHAEYSAAYIAHSCFSRLNCQINKKIHSINEHSCLPNMGFKCVNTLNIGQDHIVHIYFMKTDKCSPCSNNQCAVPYSSSWKNTGILILYYITIFLFQIPEDISMPDTTSRRIVENVTYIDK
jgi:hypothetical protein